MKTLQRVLFALLFGIASLSGFAQGDNPFEIDCDCPEPTPEDMVCVEVEGEIFPMPSACIAECLELTVVEGDCDFGGGDPWDVECDCPEPTEDDLVCVETEFGIEAFPSACFAECFGLTVVEGDCDFGGGNGGGDNPLGDCDCDYEGAFDIVCVETGMGIVEMPACLAACEELPVVECDFGGGDGDGDGNGGVDCDCDFEGAFEPVCVETDFGVITMPLCIAECEGLELVECDFGDGDGDGNGDNPWDVECDCPEPTADDIVCVETEYGIEAFPSACLAECLGLTVVEGDCEFGGGYGDGDGNGDGNGGGNGGGCDGGGNGDGDGNGNGGGDNPLGDCDCDYEGAFDIVCVETGMGIIEMPACIAACEGLELVECDFGGGDGNGDNPWDIECDCPEPTLDDIVCVETEFGITAFPSACIAECFGLTVVEGDCGDLGDWGDDPIDMGCDCEEPTEEDLVCVESPFGIVPCPSACIAECLGLTVVEGDCSDFGGNDEFNGGGVDMPQVGVQGQQANLTAARLDFSAMLVFPNPTQNRAAIQVDVNQASLTQIEVFSVTGQLVYSATIELSEGQQTIELPMTDLQVGSYILQVTDESGNKATERVVKTH